MNNKNRIAEGTNKVRISGDRNLPLIDALLCLPKEQRNELAKVIEVIPFDGYKLNIHELE